MGLDKETMRELERRAKLRRKKERKVRRPAEEVRPRIPKAPPCPPEEAVGGHGAILGSVPPDGSHRLRDQLGQGDRVTLREVVRFYCTTGAFPSAAQARHRLDTGALESSRTVNFRVQKLIRLGYLRRTPARLLIPVGVRIRAEYEDSEAGRKLALAIGDEIGSWSA